MDWAWERLHTGNWKDVDMIWRSTYSMGALLRALQKLEEGNWRGAMKLVDKSLLMGSPEFQRLAEKLADSVTDLAPQSQLGQTPAQPSDPNAPPAHPPPLSATHEIPRLLRPSLECFLVQQMQAGRPAVLEGLMDEWPARTSRPWADLAYLKRVAGLRTVPVELGEHYLADEWGQSLMPLADFIEQYIESPSPKKGYLAQTQLFEQIPRLREDIRTPDYCHLKTDLAAEDLLQVNAWFGPEGTVSPCHYDPHHNILCQAVGYKYLRLFSPDCTTALYPHSDQMRQNSSQVDVMRPDLERFPEFAKAKHWECILRPGDALYIPPKWWHYVKSLSVSFSVSFWWS